MLRCGQLDFLQRNEQRVYKVSTFYKLLASSRLGVLIFRVDVNFEIFEKSTTYEHPDISSF